MYSVSEVNTNSLISSPNTIYMLLSWAAPNVSNDPNTSCNGFLF